MDETANDSKGYIKSWRKILDNRFLMYDDNAYIVFTKLLHMVNRKTGEYTTGRFQLAELMNKKPNTLYSILVRLESQHLINITSNNKYSVISICNWHKYQSNDNSPSNNATTTRQQRDNNATTLNKKEERRKKNINNNVKLDKSISRITYKDLFYELAKILGFTEKIQLTETRLRKLKIRMKRYSIEDLKKAAKAISEDDWLQGNNPGSKRYGTIDYMLRNDEIIDRFLNDSSQSTTSLKEDLESGRFV